MLMYKCVNSCSPLYLARYVGYADIVRKLFHSDAPADIETDEGSTTLFHADRGHTEVAKSLHEHKGEDVNSKWKDLLIAVTVAGGYTDRVRGTDGNAE